ncbi:MAG: PKD domain-containing protein, partial [Bacteroidales bacterium]|jgi:PKD repeat protein|nr:PKD domain-containing protein [Bacteroidales bacterium]
VAIPSPVADFSADDQAPTIGQTVTFTDLSTNTPTSWAWVFTPGTVTYVGGTNASSQNPQVQFNAAGSYDVSLTATNAGGSDVETKVNYINVAIPAPVADFSADDQAPTIGQTVTFTDLSTNTPTSWAWVFTPNTVTYVGGTSASHQNPQVQFNAAGSYDVALTATNGSGSDTETKISYINATTPPPVADFVADNTTPETTETVNFTDLSTNSPTSWVWVFTPNTITYMNSTNANSQHPKVRFDAEGLYDVQLTATNAIGSDVELKTNYINCTNAPPPPDADFVADNLNPTILETVNFTDLSTNSPTSWAWVFTPSTITYLGGTNANSQHPQIRFDNTGLYTVQLTATNAVGSDIEIKTDYIDATDPAPVADFIADNLTPNTNETVNFTDLSTNNPTSWSWVFTPSTITYMNATNSNSQHPEVRFDVAGSYTVELSATNAGGSDTELKTDYITASNPLTPPVADFSADNLNPTIEETVNFTDLSTNAPTSWAWSFSPTTVTYMDGTNANSQDPKVRFDDPGAYTVELTATNAGGSDTETKTDYINATVVPPVADFIADNTTPDIGETVSFTDLSTNTPTSWLWSFTPSTVTYVSGTDQNSQHPQVQFDAGGLYTVELTATNAGGSDTETKTGYINAGDVFEVIATATPDVICAGRSVLLQSFPSGGSGNYTFLWTSDPSGFTSNDQNVLAYPIVTTTYTVEVDDGNQAVSADVMVTVHALPIITLGDWPEILCHENEPPVQLTATPSGGVYSGPAVTMNGLFNPEVAPLGWNVITYTYEDAFGCENSAQDSIFVDDCVGIQDPYSLNAQIVLYPNPNEGKFTIHSSHLVKRVEIINQMGKMIFSEEYNAKEIHLNMILPKGLYFVRTFISDNNKTGLVNKGLMIQ